MVCLMYALLLRGLLLLHKQVFIDYTTHQLFFLLLVSNFVCVALGIAASMSMIGGVFERAIKALAHSHTVMLQNSLRM
jgi:hypothetical protein